MKPKIRKLGTKFFVRAVAEAKNEVEVRILKDCAYKLNLQDDSLFESIAEITKPKN